MAVMSFSRLAAGGRRSTNTHLLVLVQVDPAVALAVLLHGLDAALRGDGVLHLPRGQTSLAMKGRRGDVVFPWAGDLAMRRETKGRWRSDPLGRCGDPPRRWRRRTESRTGRHGVVGLGGGVGVILNRETSDGQGFGEGGGVIWKKNRLTWDEWEGLSAKLSHLHLYPSD